MCTRRGDGVSVYIMYTKGGGVSVYILYTKVGGVCVYIIYIKGGWGQCVHSVYCVFTVAG